jgi:hypothetical protein
VKSALVAAVELKLCLWEDKKLKGNFRVEKRNIAGVVEIEL